MEKSEIEISGMTRAAYGVATLEVLP